MQLLISLLLSDIAASELTIPTGLISKNQRPLAYLPVTAFLHALTLILSVHPAATNTQKSDLCHSILWFIKLIKVLLDISCEEGCIPCRPGMDVHGRLFKSFVRSAAGCKHKLLSDIITFIFTVACRVVMMWRCYSFSNNTSELYRWSRGVKTTFAVSASAILDI